jgi:hypothetical protein
VIISAHFSNKNAFLSITLCTQSNFMSVLKLDVCLVMNVKSVSAWNLYHIASEIHSQEVSDVNLAFLSKLSH